MSFVVKVDEKNITATYNGVKLPPLPKCPMFSDVNPKKQYPYAMITPKATGT